MIAVVDSYLALRNEPDLMSGGAKYFLTEQEPPMTIIAAMRESEDSILIGADSGETETLTRLRLINENKLHKHNSLPIAWGASGNPSVGIEGFGQWLKEFEPIEDWKTLKTNCEDRMAELLAREVELAQKSKVQFDFGADTAQILLVGCLENTLRIMEINYRGKASFVTQPCHAIGAKPEFLTVAYKAFEKRGTPTLKDFDDILDAAARSFQMCDPPIHIWRVRCDGITDARTGMQLT